MHRLRIRMFLPSEYSGVAAGIEAGSDATWLAPRKIDVRRRVGGLPVCWQCDSFLVGSWLGTVPPVGWLQQDWSCMGHLEGAWRLETISWPMHFGRVYVRGVVETPDGRTQAVAQQSLLLNEPPGLPGDLQPMQPDTDGHIRFGIKPMRSLAT